jgi:hypothetical protein
LKETIGKERTKLKGDAMLEADLEDKYKKSVDDMTHKNKMLDKQREIHKLISNKETAKLELELKINKKEEAVYILKSIDETWLDISPNITRTQNNAISQGEFLEMFKKLNMLLINVSRIQNRVVSQSDIDLADTTYEKLAAINFQLLTTSLDKIRDSTIYSSLMSEYNAQYDHLTKAQFTDLTTEQRDKIGYLLEEINVFNHMIKKIAPQFQTGILTPSPLITRKTFDFVYEKMLSLKEVAPAELTALKGKVKTELGEYQSQHTTVGSEDTKFIDKVTAALKPVQVGGQVGGADGLLTDKRKEGNKNFSEEEVTNFIDYFIRITYELYYRVITKQLQGAKVIQGKFMKNYLKKLYSQITPKFIEIVIDNYDSFATVATLVTRVFRINIKSQLDNASLIDSTSTDPDGLKMGNVVFAYAQEKYIRFLIKSYTDHEYIAQRIYKDGGPQQIQKYLEENFNEIFGIEQRDRVENFKLQQILQSLFHNPTVRSEGYRSQIQKIDTEIDGFTNIRALQSKINDILGPDAISLNQENQQICLKMQFPAEKKDDQAEIDKLVKSAKLLSDESQGKVVDEIDKLVKSANLLSDESQGKVAEQSTPSLTQSSTQSTPSSSAPSS